MQWPSRKSRGYSASSNPDIRGSPAHIGENPPCFHSYGNAYTSTLVSRASCPGNTIGFFHLFEMYRLVATCPSYSCELFHSHQHQPGGQTRSFFLYLSRYDSKLIRARMCNRRVHTAQTIHSTVHTYTIIADQCSCAPVIMCVHTNPCTYVLFTDR